MRCFSNCLRVRALLQPRPEAGLGRSRACE
jgi:hypothetical protein